MLGGTHSDQSALYWWDVTVATKAMAANLSPADTVCSHTDWWLTWFLLRQNERLSLGRFAEQRAYSNVIHLNHKKMLWHCINVEDTIVDTPVHHLIVDHSSIIAAQILFNSGTQRQTVVMTTASFIQSYIVLLSVSVLMRMWFSPCQPCVPHKYVHYSHVQKASELQYCFKSKLFHMAVHMQQEQISFHEQR